MSTTLTATADLQFLATYTDVGELNSVASTLTSGSGSFAALSQTVLSTGTANTNLATILWHDQRTLAAAASEELDLLLQTNRFGTAIGFATVVWFILRIITPTTTKELTIGNATLQPWQAWFGSSTGTEVVDSICFKESQVTGWPCSVSSRYLKVANTGSVSCVYDLVLIGL